MPASDAGRDHVATTSTASCADDANVREFRFVERGAAARRRRAGASRRRGSRRAAAPPRWRPSSRPCRSRSPARPARFGRTRRASRAACAARNAVARQQLFARALLRGRHPALAQDEAADCAWRAGGSAVCVGGCLPGLSSTGIEGDRRGSVNERASTVASLMRRSSRPRRRSRPDVYSTASASAPFHATPASLHVSAGVHASSLRTPVPSIRQMASSLSHASAQKSAVAKRWWPGASTGSDGRRNSPPPRRCDDPELAAVAVRREQHDSLQILDVVPHGVRARADDVDRIAERRQANGHECDPQLVAFARRDR